MDFESEFVENGLEFMANDMGTQPTSLNSILESQNLDSGSFILEKKLLPDGRYPFQLRPWPYSLSRHSPLLFLGSASAADLLGSRVGWIDPRRIRWILNQKLLKTN